MNYSEIRRANRTDLATVAPLPKPYAIYIEPTNICNFGSQCFFCAQHLEDYKEQAGYSQNIPMDIVEKLIADIKAMGGVKSIRLHFLGEPTIHPKIGEIARLSCTVSDDVMLTTNGSRLSAEKAQQFIDSGMHYVRVSIYEETKPSMQQTIRDNIAALRRLRDEQGKSNPMIVVKWLSNNPNFGDWIRENYKDVADDFIFEGMRNFPSAFVALESMTPLTQNRTGPQIACTLPFYQMIVKSNGDVAPCCGAWNQTLNVGNIMEESLLDIWNGEKLAAIHRIQLEGRRMELSLCSTCDVIFSNRDVIDDLSVEEYDRRKACQSK